MYPLASQPSCTLNKISIVVGQDSFLVSLQAQDEGDYSAVGGNGVGLCPFSLDFQNYIVECCIRSCCL